MNELKGVAHKGIKKSKAHEESNAGKIIQTLNQNIFKRLVNIFRNVYAVAKKIEFETTLPYKTVSLQVYTKLYIEGIRHKHQLKRPYAFLFFLKQITNHAK